MTSLSSSWCQARSAGSEPQQERGVVPSAPGAPCPPHGPRHFLPKRALVTTPSQVISVTLVQSYRGTGLMSFGGNE